MQETVNASLKTQPSTVIHEPSTMPATPTKPSETHGGYKIFDGANLLSPRRMGANLGQGGELWRMSPKVLHDTEQAIRKEVQGHAGSVATNDLEQAALVSRKLAAARAEVRAGYSVDKKHEWVALGRHSMYITPAPARVAAATATLEDAFDAVSELVSEFEERITHCQWLQLHALDRISDANVICLVSFKESQPTRYPTAIIHQFASRSIVGHRQAAGKLAEIVRIFHEHIAQPSTDKLTQSTRMETTGKVGPPADLVDKLADSLKRISVASWGSQEKDESGDMNWFAYPSGLAKSSVTTPSTQYSTSAASSVTSLSPPSMLSRPVRRVSTAADALTFNKLAEQAFAQLNVPENTVLKVKVVALVADEKDWIGMFQEVGLSKEAAVLISLILKDRQV